MLKRIPIGPGLALLVALAGVMWWWQGGGRTTSECLIKGNISRVSGERIYHLPGSTYYDGTVINVAAGERWFCSEMMARAAGWRRSKIIGPAQSTQPPGMGAGVAGDITGRPRIIDGDTIVIASERIRLDWIDAPETRQQCKINGKPWRCGQAATAALKKLIGNAAVRCKTHGRGKYGRLLGIRYVGKKNINAWMVRNGWAVDYLRYSNGAYRTEQLHAQRDKLGIWRGEFEMPWEWRRRGRRN